MEQERVTQEQLTKAGEQLAFMIDILGLSISSLDLIAPPEKIKNCSDLRLQYALAHRITGNLHQTLQGIVREIDDVAYLVMELAAEELKEIKKSH